MKKYQTNFLMERMKRMVKGQRNVFINARNMNTIINEKVMKLNEAFEESQFSNTSTLQRLQMAMKMMIKPKYLLRTMRIFRRTA